MKNRHIQWWLALSFCFKVNNVNSYHPVPLPFTSSLCWDIIGTNSSTIHGGLDVLRDVTACQVWLQEDRIPAQERYSHLSLPVRRLNWNAGPGCLMDWIFTLEHSQEYTLSGYSVLTFNAASPFELLAFLTAFSLVSQHASNSTPQHATPLSFCGLSSTNE